MKTIINKTKGLLDAIFYIVTVWHIAVAHQPEPEHDKYAMIELYEHNLWVTPDEYVCTNFTLKRKDSFLGFHAQPEYDDAGQELKCRYTLHRPADWEKHLLKK